LLCDYQNILSLLSNKLDGLIKSSHVNDDYRTAQLYKLIDTIPVSVTNKRPLLSVKVEKYVQATIKANPNDKRSRYAIAIEYVEELGRNDETLYAQQQHQLNLQQPPAENIRSRPSRDTRYEDRATTTGSSGATDAHMDDYNAQLDYISMTMTILSRIPTTSRPLRTSAHRSSGTPPNMATTSAPAKIFVAMKGFRKVEAAFASTLPWHRSAMFATVASRPLSAKIGDSRKAAPR
jgi:hypothetical protein